MSVLSFVAVEGSKQAVMMQGYLNATPSYHSQRTLNTPTTQGNGRVAA
jgi:hypothetical protein